MTHTSGSEAAYSLNDFITGTPETLFSAAEDPKILWVWPHGDEELGPRVGHHMYSERPDLLKHVDYMCGNPRAAAGQNRYVETDLNRSFSPSGGPTSYEEERARAILTRIEEGGYEYVLDVHTSTTRVGRFFLANHRNEAVDTIVAASPITRTVMMPDDIAKAGLIGRVPNSVSIEYDREVALRCGVEESILLLEGLIKGTKFGPREREFFYVTRTIPKDEDPGLDAQNFEQCKDGYYPVLIGENSYRRDPTKQYLGFAATSRVVAIL